MRRILVLLVIILLASTVVASNCKDTDGGKNYGEKGETKIVSGKEDICVLNPSAEVRQDTSPYLKEYYCSNDDQIKSEIIECVREGFEKCEMGKCVGGEAEAKASGNYTAPVVAECGNSVIDPGEDCDPVNKMCFDDDGNVGLCNENCKCEVKLIWSEEAKKNKTEENETETNKTENMTKIDKIMPVEKEIKKQEEKENVSAAINKEDKEITVTIAEKPKKTVPKGFFARIWAWIAGLFR